MKQIGRLDIRVLDVALYSSRRVLASHRDARSLVSVGGYP
jgi:hypothetical protein